MVMEKSMKWVSTSKDGFWKEEEVFQTDTSSVNLTLTNQAQRIIEGFGGCFNELGFTALQHLSEEARNEVLDELFDPARGLKFSICRLPIGASDYALEWYSHNEVDGDYHMEHFNIERDRTYLIPYIKEALKRNPDMKLFASPWSPPTWMKFPKAYNYGKLRWEKEILEAYALYFVKFIEAYEQEGIKIHQIHVQNEVVADQKFPSCVWSGEELQEFIRDYLGPAFERHHIDTEIWLGTINGIVNELFQKSASDYDQMANVVLSDPEAKKYIKGVGYQWAGKYTIQQTVQSYPELRYMQTENECGDGENTWDYAQYVFNLFRHYFVNGANAYVYWNMVLEPFGLSTWGWKQNSMITVDPETRESMYNPEYYVMKHFSHYVDSDAVRIETTGAWTGNTVAFQNPDGSRVVVLANPFKDQRDLFLSNNNATYQVTLEPDSFNTFILNNEDI